MYRLFWVAYDYHMVYDMGVPYPGAQKVGTEKTPLLYVSVCVSVCIYFWLSACRLPDKALIRSFKSLDVFYDFEDNSLCLI